MLRPLFTLILFLAASAVLAGPLKITTGTLEADHAATPLEFEIRGVPENRSVVLSSLPSGKEVPCQIKKRTPTSVNIVWLAPALAKGSESVWEMDLVPADSHEVKELVTVKAAGHNIEVSVGGKELTRLVADADGPKPYLFPIIGPSGKMITRQFPMKAKLEGEDQDHPHQRSLWFTHGEVGGADFWAEGRGKGRIRQTKVEAAEGGPVFGKIETRNEWMTSDDRKVLDDHRVLTFYPLERGETLIDVAITLTAAEGPVPFGDTKEGTFGIRLAESMKEDRGGVIVNSRGQRGMKAAWGKPAEWVDYSGRIGEDVVGVAILDHPGSFRHPTHWHVRNYGLFAANPFGYRDFYGRASGKDGSFTLEKGKTMEFRYRVYFHHGGAEAAKVQDVYRGFAKPPELKPKEQKA